MDSQIPTDNVLRVCGLVRHFGEVKAVDGLDFKFRGGEVHAFIGPNGAGKTTTMRILATLDQPDAGDVIFNGHSAIAYPDRFRLHVGFMPDYLDTYPDMIVEEYLDFYARIHNIDTSFKAARLKDLTDFTGVSDLLERKVDALSKGQKQRLSLCRTLINDPAVLILDEPAAGLDPRARVELRTLVRQLADQGKAVLISSHILTELSEICDAATIIEDGQVRASESVGDLKKKVDKGNRVLVLLNTPSEERREDLVRSLLETPGVTSAETVRDGAAFTLDGEAESRARILSRLVGAGFEVTDFHVATSDLEDAFLSLTKSAHEKGTE